MSTNEVKSFCSVNVVLFHSDKRGRQSSLFSFFNQWERFPEITPISYLAGQRKCGVGTCSRSLSNISKQGVGFGLDESQEGFGTLDFAKSPIFQSNSPDVCCVVLCCAAGTPCQINKVLSHPTLPITITAEEDRHIKFFDNNSGKLIHSMVAHLDAVTSLAVDPNGLYLMSGSK